MKDVTSKNSKTPDLPQSFCVYFVLSEVTGLYPDEIQVIAAHEKW